MDGGDRTGVPPEFSPRLWPPRFPLRPYLLYPVISDPKGGTEGVYRAPFHPRLKTNTVSEGSAQGTVNKNRTLWTAAYQAPLSMGFSRQEYGSGVPLPSPNTHSYKVFNILISIIILKLFSSYSRAKEVKLRFWFSEWLISTAKKNITVNIIKEIEVKTIVPKQN